MGKEDGESWTQKDAYTAFVVALQLNYPQGSISQETFPPLPKAQPVKTAKRREEHRCRSPRQPLLDWLLGASFVSLLHSLLPISVPEQGRFL